MIDLCIIGSGLSGSFLADKISRKLDIEIYDKARGVGGRTSNRRFKNYSFDHGTHEFTAETKKFKSVLLSLKNKGILKKWEGTHLDFSFSKIQNSDKYIGVKGNNSISKYLLKNKKVILNSPVEKINFNNRIWEIHTKNQIILSKSIILTCPFKQTVKLAKYYLPKKILNLSVKMLPVITVMLVSQEKKVPISSILVNNKVIEKITNENSKNRYNTKLKLWTIQTSSFFAKKIIDNYKNRKPYYTHLISNEFRKILGQKSKFIFSDIHGWRYARSYNRTNIKSYWDKKRRIGCCADWFLGPNVEHAWLSAMDLSEKIKKTLL